MVGVGIYWGVFLSFTICLSRSGTYRFVFPLVRYLKFLVVYRVCLSCVLVGVSAYCPTIRSCALLLRSPDFGFVRLVLSLDVGMPLFCLNFVFIHLFVLALSLYLPSLVLVSL